MEDVLVEAGEEVIPGSELEELEALLKYTMEQEARVTRNLVKDIVDEIVTDAVKTSYEAWVIKDHALPPLLRSGGASIHPSTYPCADAASRPQWRGSCSPDAHPTSPLTSLPPIQ